MELSDPLDCGPANDVRIGILAADSAPTRPKFLLGGKQQHRPTLLDCEPKHRSDEVYDSARQNKLHDYTFWKPDCTGHQLRLCRNFGSLHKKSFNQDGSFIVYQHHQRFAPQSA